MEREKISPPQPANGAQDGANANGDDGAPSNGDGLEHNGGDDEHNDEDEGEDDDEDEDDSEDSSDASNQYWIFVDKQLARFRAKACKLATPDKPVEEVLRW